MTTRLVLCLAVLLLAGACTTTGGGKDRSRHRTGPPKPPHHYAHKHDRLRNRMLLAAGVMRACGRHNDARRAIWNATVTNKRPKRRGRWSGRRIGKAARLSTDGAVRRRIDGRLRCRSFEVMRLVHRIDTTHSRLRLHYPQVRPPGPVVHRPAGRPGAERSGPAAEPQSRRLVPPPGPKLLNGRTTNRLRARLVLYCFPVSAAASGQCPSG